MTRSELLTTAQVAERCQIHRDTVVNLVHRGDLRGVWFGRALRIPSDALEEFVRTGGRRFDGDDLEPYRHRCTAGGRRT